MKYSTAASALLAFGIHSCQGVGEESALRVGDSRRLFYEKIWKYEPKTKITDIASIDEDLKHITRELRKQDFVSAESIYREGGHSGSTARLTLVHHLDRDIPKGAQVVGPSFKNGDEGARGFLAAEAKQGDKEISVTYEISAVQDNYVGCTVGALVDTYTNGCFTASGKAFFPELQLGYNYTYDPATENDNLRTLLDLNLQAKQWSDTETFFKFMEYYGTDEYLDKIITAAFGFKTTKHLPNGDVDFSIYREKGNKEIVEFAIPVMTMFITVIGSMEDAITQCNRGCTGNICRDAPGMFEWDSAVAYYSGSRLDLPNDKGDFLFGFADLRCTEFRTCGENANLAVGFAKSNHDVFKLFNHGQKQVEDSDCAGLRQTKKKIEGLMTVPLIQGTLRYAHMVQGEMISGSIEKHNAEATVFALSVLPIVHACNPLDAEVIYEHLKPKETTNVDYQAVVYAFEKNYQCMNVKCSEVGGIYSAANGTYFPDSLPCVGLEVQMNDKQKKWAIGVVATLIILVAIALVLCVVRRCTRSKEVTVDLQVADGTFSDAELA